MIAVVVVGDDTLLLGLRVFRSSISSTVYCKLRQLFYYKVQQVLLQSATEHPL